MSLDFRKKAPVPLRFSASVHLPNFRVTGITRIFNSTFNNVNNDSKVGR